MQELVVVQIHIYYRKRNIYAEKVSIIMQLKLLSTLSF